MMSAGGALRALACMIMFWSMAPWCHAAVVKCADGTYRESPCPGDPARTQPRSASTEAARSQPPAYTYVAVSLPKNVSIEVPRNWVVISNNQRITLDATVIARQNNSGIADYR